MSLNTNYPVVNPRLGASFAIFTSAFCCLVLMLMILEQLGLSRSSISQIIVLAPVAFYMAIGILVRTISVEDFFVSGQRVPALYNGLSLTANALGGFAVLSVTGALFFIGGGALPILIGLCAGLALTAMLFASNLRKAGAYTLPGFLGLRFSSRAVRAVAAALALPICIIILAAEIKLGAAAAAYFLPLNQQTLIAGGLFCVAATVIPGGVRSLTWTQCAQTIVTGLGIAIPVIAVSVLLTNLPLPPLTYGSTLQDLSQLEVNNNLISARGPSGLSSALPSQDFETLKTAFGTLFSAVSQTDFIMLIVCVMCGIAVMPAQIARLSVTPGVPAMRKSLGWAVLFAGAIALTLPAYAAFVKFYAASELTGQSGGLAAWGVEAQRLGMIRPASGDRLADAGSEILAVKRDAVLLLLPMAAKLPYVFFGVAAAAAIAAVLAAAGAQLTAIGTVISNDVHSSLINRAASPGRRLFIARFSMLLAAAGAGWIAMSPGYDPMRLILWALSLSAGAFFAVMTLSVWWSRMSAAGAIGGMLAGFGATALCIAATQGSDAAWFGAGNLTAGIAGVPAAAAAAIAISTLAPDGEQNKDFVEEMRVSGGETLYARSLRMATRGRAAR